MNDYRNYVGKLTNATEKKRGFNAKGEFVIYALEFDEGGHLGIGFGDEWPSLCDGKEREWKYKVGDDWQDKKGGTHPGDHTFYPPSDGKPTSFGRPNPVRAITPEVTAHIARLEVQLMRMEGKIETLIDLARFKTQDLEEINLS